MGDVNNDGHPDFVVAKSGSKGVMINGHDASVLWQKTLADQSWNVANMGDINWDGINDAAIGTLYTNNQAYFLDGTNGVTLEMVSAAGPVDALGAIPDITGDNSRELVVGERYGGIVCLSGGYDSTLISVPRHDKQFSQWAYAWPNPCDDVLHIVVTLQRSSDVKITVTDIQGRVVYASGHSKVNAGRNLFGLDRAMFSSEGATGIYILSVETAEGVQHLKVVGR
jgi:hypothetical protein